VSAVIAFDDDHIGIGDGYADGLCGLIFLRIVAVERSLHGWKFDHDISAATSSLHGLPSSAPGKKLRAEPLEGGFRRSDIILVALGITYIDMGDPVSFRHLLPP